jgi:uncharacterized protein YdeI (YjbR/CyaY-like superfamily)
MNAREAKRNPKVDVFLRRNIREIVKMKPILKAYIREAIEVEKAGLDVSYKKTSEFKTPAEFQKKLDEIPALKTAFSALTQSASGSAPYKAAEALAAKLDLKAAVFPGGHTGWLLRPNGFAAKLKEVLGG